MMMLLLVLCWYLRAYSNRFEFHTGTSLKQKKNFLKKEEICITKKNVSTNRLTMIFNGVYKQVDNNF